jgi:hypothetical protein
MGNFSIKYIGDEHLKHLFAALWTETYKIVEDWKSNLYCGISLAWNYDKRYVDIVMPAYVAKQLLWYEHPHPTKPQHCPYIPNPIKYGQDNQATDPIDTSPELDEANKKLIQQFTGSFLYYARAVNPTILIWYYLLSLANMLCLLKTNATKLTSSLTTWPLIPMPKYNIALPT